MCVVPCLSKDLSCWLLKSYLFFEMQLQLCSFCENALALPGKNNHLFPIKHLLLATLTVSSSRWGPNYTSYDCCPIPFESDELFSQYKYPSLFWALFLWSELDSHWGSCCLVWGMVPLWSPGWTPVPNTAASISQMLDVILKLLKCVSLSSAWFWCSGLTAS